MGTAVLCIVIGYISGSVLFARLASFVFHAPGILQNSSDANPGAANAFQYGGFWCGTVVLLGDLLKGAFPVWLYRYLGGDFTSAPVLAALVLAAPVLGHAFPVFFGFRGGKGIAATFGCLAGLLPRFYPLAALAAQFIILSTVIRITPHLQRTLIAYILTLLSLLILQCGAGICLGFLLITLTVCLRLHMSTEERTEMKLKLLWMH